MPRPKKTTDETISFISREREPYHIDFMGDHGTRLSDGRLGWRFPKEVGERAMNHALVQMQRIVPGSWPQEDDPAPGPTEVEEETVED